MIRLNSIFTVSFLALFLIFHGCESIQPPIIINQSPGERIYSNSFETVSDTAGWYGFIGISNDAPRSGGSHSAYVSGGCLHPHTWYNLKAFKQDSYLIIKCWGKNLSNGGGVELDLNNYQKQIYISVTDSNWKVYQSPDTLFCPKGSNIRLSMSAGGYVPSAMLVDLIEIIRVK